MGSAEKRKRRESEDPEEKRAKKAKRKTEIREHNEAVAKAGLIAQSIFPVGSCTCGGTLFLYLSSQDENIRKIYCDSCEEIRDVFEPKDGPIFFVSPQKQAELLVQAYGEEKMASVRT